MGVFELGVRLGHAMTNIFVSDLDPIIIKCVILSACRNLIVLRIEFKYGEEGILPSSVGCWTKPLRGESHPTLD